MKEITRIPGIREKASYTIIQKALIHSEKRNYHLLGSLRRARQRTGGLVILPPSSQKGKWEDREWGEDSRRTKRNLLLAFLIPRAGLDLSWILALARKSTSILIIYSTKGWIVRNRRDKTKSYFRRPEFLNNQSDLGKATSARTFSFSHSIPYLSAHCSET